MCAINKPTPPMAAANVASQVYMNKANPPDLDDSWFTS